jgi:hypothetical protein
MSPEPGVTDMALNVVIDIPGDINHGLESPGRGEGRWAQNWAKFLASEGHQVTCICWPHCSWGQMAPIPNCNLKGFCSSERIDCDIFMHAAWWKGRDIGNIHAKTYVHLGYGFEPHLVDPTFITKGHVVAYPYVATSSNFLHSGNPFINKTFCLPIPMMETFHTSAFGRAEMTYSAKDAFIDRVYSSASYFTRNGYFAIKAMVDLSKQYQISCNFLSGEELLNPGNRGIVDYKIIDLLGQIDKKRIFPLLTLGEVYQLLETTKVLVSVIPPGGSMMEGVAHGVVPLTFVGSIFDEEARGENFLLSSVNATYEDIRYNMERLIVDKNFYDGLVLKYQKSMESHLYASSRKFFKLLSDFSE